MWNLIQIFNPRYELLVIFMKWVARHGACVSIVITFIGNGCHHTNLSCIGNLSTSINKSFPSLYIYRKSWAYQCSVILLFRAQEPKAPVTYCDHALSAVRPSVKQFTFSTSSPELLDGFWWNFVWMKYSRSLTSVVVFRPDPLGGGSRAGPK